MLAGLVLGLEGFGNKLCCNHVATVLFLIMWPFRCNPTATAPTAQVFAGRTAYSIAPKPGIMAPRVVLALLATAAGAMKCPGSGSWIHAWAEVEAVAGASCADVMEEMKARVGGGSWVDPHNKGTYSLLSEDTNELDVQRITGNKKFTDKITFTFFDFKLEGAKPSCGIHACSESQGFSIGDFSTNYCNIRNLYCGKEDGCVTVKHDFETREDVVDHNLGAGEDKTACIVPATLVV